MPEKLVSVFLKLELGWPKVPQLRSLDFHKLLQGGSRPTDAQGKRLHTRTTTELLKTLRKTVGRLLGKLRR